MNRTREISRALAFSQGGLTIFSKGPVRGMEFCGFFFFSIFKELFRFTAKLGGRYRIPIYRKGQVSWVPGTQVSGEGLATEGQG